jgi:hypothetical protein
MDKNKEGQGQEGQGQEGQGQEGQGQEGQAPAPFVPEKTEKTKQTASAKFKGIDMASSSDPNFVGKTQAHISNSRKARIIIPSTETQREDVFLSVNGVNRLIKRDMEVELELPFIEALNHATMTVFTQTKREDGEGYDMKPREVLRYPYRMATV